MRLEARRGRDRGKRRLSADLIAELAQRADDVELVRVFADWLLQQGHPVGELAIVQLERMARDSDALARREADLLANHVNPFATQLLRRVGATELTWRGGLLDTIKLRHQGGEEQLEEVFPRLATDPVMRLVRRLEIGAVEFDGVGDLEPAIRVLAELALPRLRELVIYEGLNIGSPWVDGPIRIGDVSPLYAAYPRLETLELSCKEYELGEIVLPALQRLVLENPRPTDIASIARGTFPVLADLRLFFGAWRVDGIDAMFRPLFERDLPSLVAVRIGTEVPQVMQYFVRALPGSQLARHARVIGFTHATLDDDCVRTLVHWAPRLRALQLLEVETRGMAPDQLATLQRTFGRMLVPR